jgi:Cu/Zn superoxide dismutase
MTRRFLALSRYTALIAATAVLAACPGDDDPDPWPTTDRDTVPTVRQDQRVEDRVYEAQLQEVNGSGVTGTATITMSGDDIRVRIRAQGLQPDARVPQHVHMNASCDSPGGILLNLDDDLSHPNEAAPRGDHYPTADGNGTLDYEASRSLDDLRDAARQHQGMEADRLDLGNRVVNLHGADMQAIACGPLDARTGTGTQPR